MVSSTDRCSVTTGNNTDTCDDKRIVIPTASVVTNTGLSSNVDTSNCGGDDVDVNADLKGEVLSDKADSKDTPSRKLTRKLFKSRAKLLNNKNNNNNNNNNTNKLSLKSNFSESKICAEKKRWKKIVDYDFDDASDSFDEYNYDDDDDERPVCEGHVEYKSKLLHHSASFPRSETFVYLSASISLENLFLYISLQRSFSIIFLFFN